MKLSFFLQLQDGVAYGRFVWRVWSFKVVLRNFLRCFYRLIASCFRETFGSTVAAIVPSRKRPDNSARDRFRHGWRSLSTGAFTRSRDQQNKRQCDFIRSLGIKGYFLLWINWQCPGYLWHNLPREQFAFIFHQRFICINDKFYLNAF